MSAFDLVPSEAAAKMERRSSVDLNEGPGFFSGALSAPFAGAAKGLVVEPARVLNLGLSHIPGAIDQAFGTSSRDWWFDHMMLERPSRALTPNPREVGMAGQMLNSLFDVGGQAVATGPAGVAMLKTVGKSIEGVEEGLDPLTAMKKGAIEGASAAVGVALPIAIKPFVGSRIPALVQQIGYGVGTNVPMGIASRMLTHEVLDKGGYHDMAEQYKALDEAGLMTDAVLGIAFGALGHAITSKGARLPLIRPADVDAALAKRNAYHIEVDTAPGLARNGETRDAHVDSVLKATEDLMAGRPVDVTETLRAADFEANPAIDKTRERLVGETAKIAEAYDKVRENPFGAADDPTVRMTPDDIGAVLLERGPALPPKGELEVRPGGFGLVKIMWKHGEKSKKDPATQVTREDVMRTPEVLQNYAPITDERKADGRHFMEWQVERADGKKVIYATSNFTETDKQHHVVTVFVNEGTQPKIAAKPLSKLKDGGPESPAAASKAQSSGDTGPGASSSRPQAVETGHTVAQIRDALNREGIDSSDANVATVDLIARARAADEAAVDALPEDMPDAQYLAKLEEIADAKQKTEGAGAPGKGAAQEGSRAAGGGPGRDEGAGAKTPGGKPGEAAGGGAEARAVEAAEIRGAEEVARANPDMLVTMEDGTTVPAHQALAKADEVIAQAEADAKGLEAAVLCATRRGG